MFQDLKITPQTKQKIWAEMHSQEKEDRLVSTLRDGAKTKMGFRGLVHIKCLIHAKLKPQNTHTLQTVQP